MQEIAILEYLALSIGPVLILGVGLVLLKILRKKNKYDARKY